MPNDIGYYLYGGIYEASCRFANIERFVDRVSEKLDLSESVSFEKVREKLSGLAKDLEETGAVSTEAQAQDVLIAKDIREILATEFLGTGDDQTVEDRLKDSGPPIQERLKRVGLEVQDSPLRIVDEFPPPFSRFEWSAFAPDREDEQQFDIPRGVYFRLDRLRPLYSEALYAHEVVHTITGRTDPEVYAMGLEEGIAEVLGTCYASLAVLSPDVVRKVLIYGRHGSHRAKLWSVYLDHTRQAYLLYQRFGLEGLAALVNRGRAAIHRAEHLILTDRLDRIDLPRGAFNDETEALVQHACCGYLPSHVFSPLECLLALEAFAGSSLVDVCRRANVPPEVGVPVLEELGARSALFVQGEGRINYSNVDRYVDAQAEGGAVVIRYLPLK